MINGTQSAYEAYLIDKENNNISNASEMYNKSNSKQKRFFTQVDTNTRRIGNKSYLTFVMELMSMTEENANKYILNGYVSINANICSDITTVLNINDVVRGGVGHYLKGSNYMAVVN